MTAGPGSCGSGPTIRESPQKAAERGQLRAFCLRCNRSFGAGVKASSACSARGADHLLRLTIPGAQQQAAISAHPSNRCGLRGASLYQWENSRLDGAGPGPRRRLGPLCARVVGRVGGLDRRLSGVEEGGGFSLAPARVVAPGAAFGAERWRGRSSRARGSGAPVLGAEAALRSRPRRAPGELGRVGGVRLWAWGLGLDTRSRARAGVCAGGAGWV